MRLFRFQMERARRFERPTLTLARLCSTPELRPRCHLVRRGLGNPASGCKRKICASRQKLLCVVRGGGCGMRSQKSERPHPKMRPFRFRMERARRFERPTLTLARLCSTPELRPRCHSVRRDLGNPVKGCKRKIENWVNLLARLWVLVRSAGGQREKRKAASDDAAFSVPNGAGEAIRTPDPNLGKVMLYP